jgi:hypothetical protein
MENRFVTDDCNVDQWLTSALAAMLYAHANWPGFGEWWTAAQGAPVPITQRTMLHHAHHLTELVDPERMPET